VRGWIVAAIIVISGCGDRPVRQRPDATAAGDAGIASKDAVAEVDASEAIDASAAVDASMEDAGSGEDAGAPQDVTWYRDVVPVVQANCIGCHRAGGIAPFSMESYETAAPKAMQMAAWLVAGFMPPWPPSDDCQPYSDARTVTDREKAIVVRWAELGAPEGDPADAPDPIPPDELERIDVEADPGVDYTPSGADDYRCFIVDLGLTETEQLEALEIIPGVRWMVHHVVLFQANAFQAESADANEPGPGWTCFGGPGVGATSPLDSLSVGAWAPGTPVTRYPAGTGIDLGLGNVIVMQVHYHLNGSRPAEADRTTIRMQFAENAVTPAYVSSVYDYYFAIPPRDPNGSVTTYASSVTWPLTIGGRLYGVFPHMHLLGRRIELTYSPPGGGASTCLSNIPLWQFHWQQFYFYDRAPIELEVGGTLQLTCEWNRPEEGTIYWGEGSEDEMCIVGLYVTQ
jgi:hypothetical protein